MKPAMATAWTYAWNMGWKLSTIQPAGYHWFEQVDTLRVITIMQNIQAFPKKAIHLGVVEEQYIIGMCVL